MDTKAYWKKINDLVEKLPKEGAYIISLQNDEKGTHAGNVTHADTKLAAQRIVEQTHRIATPEEIKAAKDRSEAVMAENRLKALRRAPRTVLVTQDQAAAADLISPVPPETVTEQPRPGRR